MTPEERKINAEFDEAFAGAILHEQQLRFHQEPWNTEVATRLARAARVYAEIVLRVHQEHASSGPCFIPALGAVVN